MKQRQKSKLTAREAVRERNRSAYRELILEAAERVFVERGFARTRISDVAKEAGVATGTVYNYFEGKDDVFRSLMQLRFTEFIDKITAVYEENKDPIKRIEAMIRFVVQDLDEHADMYALIVGLGAMSEASIGVIGGDELANQYTQYVAVFERAFRAASRAKRLKSTGGKPADLAAFVTGAINGVARMWVVSGRSTSLTAAANFIIATFREGAVQ